MDSFPRSLCLHAATAMVAVMLSGPVPAFAAEQSPAASTLNKASITPIKHRAPGRISHHVAPVRPLASDLGCSGLWCGRQFVLIVGIGY
jgi:hypothetical protein